MTMTTTTSPVSAAAPRWRFSALLAVVLLALLVLTRVEFGGDMVEYTVTTVGVANHGIPEVRLDDIDQTISWVPHLAGPLGPIRADVQAGVQDVWPAFARGRDGRVYAIHFFAYPALAAIPFKISRKVGLPPFKAYQIVNFAAVFILGLALRRFFGSEAKAWFGLGLFLACGGVLYLNWSSPECFTAALLLAALLLFLTDKPAIAGVLAGLGALQNPTIVLFAAFAPLLKLYLDWDPRTGPKGNLARLRTRGHLIGALACGALFALPLLFGLVQFGVPSLTAKRFSDHTLISFIRMVSFYFDLNQGMILAIPGVALVLAVWGWSSGGAARRNLGLLGLCLLFTLALAFPTFAVLNWNSGAIGVMRYAFWGAMPLLLALLLRLRASPRWPAGLLAAMFAVQAAAMAHAFSYSYTDFSPLAQLVLDRAPGWYHPEPEIFAERAGHNDNYIEPKKVYLYREPNHPWKTLYAPAHPDAAALLCGPGRMPAPDNRFTDTAHGWRYIDGEVRCIPAAGAPAAAAR